MPKYNLEVCGQLENVQEFRPTSSDTFEWRIKFRCGSCNEERETFRVLIISDKFPDKNGRAEFNLVETCQFCGTTSTVDILEKEASYPYTEDDSGNFKAVCSLDCRGLEPTGFDFGRGYIVAASHSKLKFDDVDLTENEWNDYDENAKEPIGISELEFRFIRRK